MPSTLQKLIRGHAANVLEGMEKTRTHCVCPDYTHEESCRGSCDNDSKRPQSQTVQAAVGNHLVDQSAEKSYTDSLSIPAVYMH